jgi:hypothetical protein
VKPGLPWKRWWPEAARVKGARRVWRGRSKSTFEGELKEWQDVRPMGRFEITVWWLAKRARFLRTYLLPTRRLARGIDAAGPFIWTVRVKSLGMRIYL